MTVSRRFLLGAGAAAGVLVLTGVEVQAAQAASASKGAFGTPYLPVSADGGKLSLPQGFKATRVSTIGVEPLLDDRFGRVIGTTPATLDGMGCFEVGGKLRLVRNHECRASADVPVPLVAGTVYDPGCHQGMGGCTVVETIARAASCSSGWDCRARSATAPAERPRGARGCRARRTP